MSNLYPYHLVGREDGTQYLTVFLPGRLPLTVADDHPKFADIHHGVTDGTRTAEELEELADISIGVERFFENVTERVAVSNGAVFFDGDEVHSSVAKALVRALDADTADDALVALALAAFMEKVADNPEEHSREQLYDWLDAHDFAITATGDVIGYKGVHGTDEEGLYKSGSSGRAIVNGQEQHGQIEQRVGDVVTMPRSAVQHDPSASCSTGLHVGTFDYASRFATSDGAVLKVAVNPRDVVSVPTDAGGDKVRVSRYRIIEADTEAVEALVDYADDGADDDIECAYCGETAETTDIDGDPACVACAEASYDYE